MPLLRDLCETLGISINIVGDISLLPPRVASSAARAHLATKHNTRAILNICSPYTSRHEISVAMACMATGIQRGWILEEDVSEELLERCLDVGSGYQEGRKGQGKVDLLVRTSGELRLSDFLLWQASKGCQIHFLEVLWPEFTFWHMIPVLLSYQLAVVRRQMWAGWRTWTLQWSRAGSKEKFSTEKKGCPISEKRIQRFLDRVWEEREKEWEARANMPLANKEL